MSFLSPLMLVGLVGILIPPLLPFNEAETTKSTFSGVRVYPVFS